MQDNKRKINTSKLIKPGLVFLAGIIICAICAPLTQSVNSGVGLGLLTLMVGTVMLLFAIYKEIYRIGIEMPFPLNKLFPNYPIVEDRDEVETHINGFRQSLDEYLGTTGTVKNSTLQNYSSQLLWHSISLWKNRMAFNDITLRLESNRRAYTSKKNSVRCEDYFDGRYDVKDVYEEIDATRTFIYKGHEIKKLYDKEVAHFTLLSAKETDDGKTICPNCGGTTTKKDLIDGCDYCDTKFTVEDIENSVSSFGFRRDFAVCESKREAMRALIYPWVFVITEMPFVYFGFFGAFLYMTESVFARLFTGILTAVILGLFGLFFVKINMGIVLPSAIERDAKKERENRKIIFRPEDAINQEIKIAEYVRQFDSKFSIQSYFGGIQNKLLAIHFADNGNQINAFSDVDLSGLLDGYRSVVDVDVTSMTLCSYKLMEGSYENPDGIQTSEVEAELVLRDLIHGNIVERTEHVEMKLSKNGRCRTQAVCAPSLMKCEKCGGSLSLMEGKVCSYCGHELDLKKYDWVISEYKVVE